MPSRFDADFADPTLDLDPYIDEVFSELKSGFMELPKGRGFVEYPVFEQGYEVLKKTTVGFTSVEAELITATVYATPIALIVLRSILGFTPSEWADVTTEKTGVTVDQGSARTLDRRIRVAPTTPIRDRGSVTDRRLKAMIATAVMTLKQGVGNVDLER